MTRTEKLDRLRRLEEAALAVLGRGVQAMEEGPAAVEAVSPAIRRELGDALSAYQTFKHRHVFDPAIASGDDLRAALARHMKVSCIAASEVFRAHMRRWRSDRIAADWAIYKPAARLTANQLRRHIVSEGESIVELIEAYG